MIGIIFDDERSITADILNVKNIRVLPNDIDKRTINNKFILQNKVSCVLHIKYGENLILPVSFNSDKSLYVQINTETWTDKQPRIFGHNKINGDCQNIQVQSNIQNHPLLPDDFELLSKFFREKKYDSFVTEGQNEIKKYGVSNKNIMIVFYIAIIYGLIKSDFNSGLSFVRQGLTFKHDFSEFYTIAGDIYIKNAKYDLAKHAYEQSIKTFNVRNLKDQFPYSYQRSIVYANSQIEKIKNMNGKTKKIITLHLND